MGLYTTNVLTRVNVAPFLPGASRYIPCDNDQEWFPAVGLDSPDTIHVNFGQQPFKCDHVIGAFMLTAKL